MNSYRRFVQLVLLAFAAVAASFAHAAYPDRPLRLIVGFPPGGASDLVARQFATILSANLKQPVLVDNRTGAGGNIAAVESVKSAPDGYTMLLGDNGTLVYNKVLFTKMQYDTDRDLQPLALVAKVPMFVVINKDFPASTLNEFTAEARRRPIPFASSGMGNPTHMAMEFLKSALGFDLVHVPYRGAGPALLDVSSGQVVGMIAGLSTIRPFMQTGKVKILAVVANERTSAMPSVPTVKEATGTAVDATGWLAIALPIGVPPAISERLRAAIQATVSSPGFAHAMNDAGFVAATTTPQQLSQLLRDERTRRELVKKMGITAE
jgi:tripartite-type tricarboxylate transporter receptor subunit TctC